MTFHVRANPKFKVSSKQEQVQTCAVLRIFMVTIIRFVCCFQGGSFVHGFYYSGSLTSRKIIAPKIIDMNASTFFTTDAKGTGPG